MARSKRQPTFADMVEDAKAHPRTEVRRPPGLGADARWTDPAGRRYELVDSEVSATKAAGLVDDRTAVVHDGCGCGGRDCATPLHWLAEAEVADLLDSEPDLHPSRHGSAAVEHWRSADGRTLLVLLNEVSWGAAGPPA